MQKKGSRVILLNVRNISKTIQVLEDYRLSNAQELRFLHNLLTKDAQRFFLDKVKLFVDLFEQAVALMEK